MQKIFKNILVPVVLNNKTGTAIARSIEFANSLRCHLHLLFIIRQTVFSFGGTQRLGPKRKEQIQSLKKKCHQEMRSGLKFFSAIREGNTRNVIDDYARTSEIDLVLTS